MNTKKNKTRQERPKNEPQRIGKIMEEMGIFPYGHPIYSLKIKKA